MAANAAHLLASWLTTAERAVIETPGIDDGLLPPLKAFDIRPQRPPTMPRAIDIIADAACERLMIKGI